MNGLEVLRHEVSLTVFFFSSRPRQARSQAQNEWEHSKKEGVERKRQWRHRDSHKALDVRMMNLFFLACFVSCVEVDRLGQRKESKNEDLLESCSCVTLKRATLVVRGDHRVGFHRLEGVEHASFPSVPALPVRFLCCGVSLPVMSLCRQDASQVLLRLLFAHECHHRDIVEGQRALVGMREFLDHLRLHRLELDCHGHSTSLPMSSRPPSLMLGS